jgi:hypothetical protein
MRLMRECERLRKLLSQLPTASVTIENISDSGDVNITMTREEMARICAEPLQKLSEVLSQAVEGISEEISAIELVGGGVRMAMVQEMILSAIGKELPLGAKLDDGSLAVGAAILANEQADKAAQDLMAALAGNATPEAESADTSPAPLPDSPTLGLSLESLHQARQAEATMQVSHPCSLCSPFSESHASLQEKDREVRELLECRNVLEGYILDMKGVPNRKHGQAVDKVALNTALESKENWLWDHGESASLSELQQEVWLAPSLPPLDETYPFLNSQFAQLKEQIEGQLVEDQEASGETRVDAPAKKRRVGGICSDYLNAVELDRMVLEESLAADAAIAAEQR